MVEKEGWRHQAWPLWAAFHLLVHDCGIALDIQGKRESGYSWLCSFPRPFWVHNSKEQGPQAQEYARGGSRNWHSEVVTQEKWRHSFSKCPRHPHSMTTRVFLRQHSFPRAITDELVNWRVDQRTTLQLEARLRLWARVWRHRVPTHRYFSLVHIVMQLSSQEA